MNLPIEFAGEEPAMTDYETRPGCYGPSVRVMCRPGPAPSCDLCVEVADVTQPGGWREVIRFNDMADDFASVNAHNKALHVRQQLLEGEVP